jgi:hypothetical protein
MRRVNDAFTHACSPDVYSSIVSKEDSNHRYQYAGTLRTLCKGLE